MPKRIQRKRIKGWRMPENAIYVGQLTKWGNPFSWEDYVDYYHNEIQARQLAVDYFKDWLEGRINLWQGSRQKLLASLDELRGFDLACWCSLDEPCHADVLLRLANEDGG